MTLSVARVEVDDDHGFLLDELQLALDLIVDIVDTIGAGALL